MYMYCIQNLQVLILMQSLGCINNFKQEQIFVFDIVNFCFPHFSDLVSPAHGRERARPRHNHAPRGLGSVHRNTKTSRPINSLLRKKPHQSPVLSQKQLTNPQPFQKKPTNPRSFLRNSRPIPSLFRNNPPIPDPLLETADQSPVVPLTFQLSSTC